MALTKASITNADFQSEKIDCLFNPTEYVIARTNSWKERTATGKETPALTFSGGGARTLTMDLFFDVFEQDGGDVRTIVDKLWKLMTIDSRLKNTTTQQGRPPLVIFQWGPNWSFKAAITNLSVRYTLFRDDGTPVRATASVTFQEWDENVQGQNPTSLSREPGRKRREVRPNDTLALIAYEEYGDATKWRLLADENSIEDPLNLQPGSVLAIPPM